MHSKISQKLRFASAENEELSKVLSFTPGVSEIIALHVSPAARNSAWIISALPVHSTSFPNPPLSQSDVCQNRWLQLGRKPPIKERKKNQKKDKTSYLCSSKANVDQPGNLRTSHVKKGNVLAPIDTVIRLSDVPQ